MNDNDATIAREKWLTEKFGKATVTSYTGDANFTAYFPAEPYIKGQDRRVPVRGYGATQEQARSELFGAAAKIEKGEVFVTCYGANVEPDAAVFPLPAPKPKVPEAKLIAA